MYSKKRKVLLNCCKTCANICCEKEKWLKERGYKKEDFDKEVYGETNETIDKNEETRYSKKTARYINNQLNVPTLSYIRNELKKLYGDLDSGIANGLAVEMDNSVFIVDSGIEDGKIDFGVRQKKVILYVLSLGPLKIEGRCASELSRRYETFRFSPCLY